MGREFQLQQKPRDLVPKPSPKPSKPSSWSKKTSKGKTLRMARRLDRDSLRGEASEGAVSSTAPIAK